MEQEHVPARAAYRLREIAVHLVAGQAVEQDDCSVRAAAAGQIKRRVQIDAVARETDNSKRGRKLLVRRRIGHDRRRHLLRQRRVCCEWPESEYRAAMMTWVTSLPGGPPLSGHLGEVYPPAAAF